MNPVDLPRRRAHKIDLVKARAEETERVLSRAPHYPAANHEPSTSSEARDADAVS